MKYITKQECLNSPDFESASCLFSCYDGPGPCSGVCSCLLLKDGKTIRKQFKLNEKEISDFYTPISGVQPPNMFKKCLLKNLKAPATMECHIYPVIENPPPTEPPGQFEPPVA